MDDAAAPSSRGGTPNTSGKTPAAEKQVIFALTDEEADKVLWWKHWYDRPPSDCQGNPSVSLSSLRAEAGKTGRTETHKEQEVIDHQPDLGQFGTTDPWRVQRVVHQRLSNVPGVCVHQNEGNAHPLRTKKVETN